MTRRRLAAPVTALEVIGLFVALAAVLSTAERTGVRERALAAYGAAELAQRALTPGDTTYDRAVGPLQFLPTTWARFGADGNGDGVRDPHQIDDAAAGAAAYLGADGRDTADGAGWWDGVLTYNRSGSYARTVWARGAGTLATVADHDEWCEPGRRECRACLRRDLTDRRAACQGRRP